MPMTHLHACGSIESLLTWWRKLVQISPSFGYYPNPSKTWLLVKDGYLDKAKDLFSDPGLSITCEGRPVLGSPLGTSEFISNWVQKKVVAWVGELLTQTELSKVHPQAVLLMVG